jgi:hypothetical protein
VGVNLARLWVIGDMGGLVGPPLRFAKAGFTILSSFSFSWEVADIGDPDAEEVVLAEVDRRLMMTGNRVRPVRNTNLAIRTGSRSNEVRLSPCILSSSDPSALFGRASLERIFPTEAVT